MILRSLIRFLFLDVAIGSLFEKLRKNLTFTSSDNIVVGMYFKEIHLCLHSKKWEKREVAMIFPAGMVVKVDEDRVKVVCDGKHYSLPRDGVEFIFG